MLMGMKLKLTTIFFTLFDFANAKKLLPKRWNSFFDFKKLYKFCFLELLGWILHLIKAN
jgi:hypothetical protein